MSSLFILSLPLELPNNNSSKSPLLPPLSPHRLRGVARFYSLRQSTTFPNSFSFQKSSPSRGRNCICFLSGEESEQKVRILLIVNTNIIPRRMLGIFIFNCLLSILWLNGSKGSFYVWFRYLEILHEGEEKEEKRIIKVKTEATFLLIEFSFGEI